MRTLLYSSIFLDGKDRLGSNRIDRTVEWLAYHEKLKEEIGFDHILMSDNCSDMKNLAMLGLKVTTDDDQDTLNPESDRDASVMSFRRHLPTGEGLDYPYCWRSLYFVRWAAMYKRWDKIIMIDNDAFVLSKKLADYLKAVDTGWTALWCERWKFPESSMMIICRDAFHILDEFCVDDFRYHNGKKMEEVTPFTNVEKRFVGDRYGEESPPRKQDGSMDYYCQKPTSINVKFRSEI